MSAETYILKYINKNKSFFIIASLLLGVGLLCHGYMFFNKLPNFDEMGSINGYLGIATPSGRWALPFAGILNGPFSSPAINGFLCALFLIASTFIISDTLQIKSKLSTLCIGCVLISFPTITSSLTFMFTSFAYMLSLFLEVLSVWLAVSDIALFPKFQAANPKAFQCLKFLISACLMATGLGIYQAYYQVACTVILIYGMQSLLSDDLRLVWKKALKLFCLLIVSMGIYLIMAKVGCFFSGKEMSVTYGAGSVPELLANLPHALTRCYRDFASVFYSDFRGISHNLVVRLLITVSFLIGICLYEALLLKRHKSLLLGNALLLLFPIALEVIGFTMVSRGMDTLTVYSYALILVFPFAMLSLCDFKVNTRILNFLYSCVMISSLLLTWQYAILANNVYTTMDLAKLEASSYYTTMVTQIKSLDHYSTELPLCLLGTNSEDETLYDLSAYYKGDVRGQMTCDRYINMYSRHYFLSVFLGYDPQVINWQDFIPAADQQTCLTLQEMPCYPEAGSIAIINDTVIVKLSNDYLTASSEKPEWRD